ncbi:dihydrolipoyllysine-residue acetyltransferase [Ferrimonas gelatinilytica]|uniref:Dihydrolipoamide acetyltransferase component of pyruvate dehydrogenase complex n=1 Tax=Ferrimonas gelatinilytica TaxID=1255257 RepID=A0ABP9S169_9GAMM
MIKEFILPDIGEGVVECELINWLVQEGDRISEDQPVVEVMTDKAMVEIPAPYDGVVTKLHYRTGEIAKVHEPLFQVEVEGAEPAASEAVASASTVSAPPAPERGTESKQTAIREFILPDIGEGIVECELIDWLVAEGDHVEEDQPVCDVMTDKASVQIPAKEAGVITKLHYRKGQVAKVHEPLFAMEVVVSPSEVDAPQSASAQRAEAATPANRETESTTPVSSGKALASPAVRRLAREHELDLGLVPGSGKNGRVFKEDVHRYLAAKEQAPSAPSPETVVSSVKDRVEPIRGVRAAMARQMTASVQSIPHFTYCEELDLTELVALRQRFKAQLADSEVKITLMPFFIKALSLALAEFPVVNSRVNDDCTELTYLNDHNIGMAVDGKLGLLVPNIKRVQDCSLLDVAAEVTRLTEAARSGRVSPNDLAGGTISISNIGALGGTVATPIINKPEVAIVALGKLQELPRFNDKGEVEKRVIMQVSWSGDHRVIDGGTIARFCNLWKRYLESPEQMLLSMK